MSAPFFITESWLAENAVLTAGGEVRLPANSRLTPAARDVLNGLKIRIRYADEAGRVFVDAPGQGADGGEHRQRVHPLTSSATHETAHCQLCQQAVTKKSEALTHLNATTFVAKNDPRIAFRGRVDTAIAQAVLLQVEWKSVAMPAVLQRMLADVRGALGNVLRAEALDEAMAPIVVGEFDEVQIHALSHNPLKHLGHDHIVPSIEHGLAVARLNLLRAVIREAEVAGAQAFIDRDFVVRRNDVLQALNRLSSAVLRIDAALSDSRESRRTTMNLIESCMAAAKAKPARVVFPDAIDERAIHAAQRLARQGWAKPVLLANPFELRRYCKQRGIVLGDVPVIDPQYSQRLDAYVEHYCAHRPGVLPEEASAQMRDPLWFGAMMLAQGDTDLCIAGNLAATASVLRAGLRVIGLAEGMKTVSSIMFLISPDGERVLGFADCGVVPEPNSEQLADIAIAAADNYRAVTGITSRVAMLSFSTKGSAKHTAVDSVRQATELAKSRRPDLIIDGELQFDAAIAPAVAAQKAPGSPLEGNANVFVFPSLSAGNIGAKIAQRMGKYNALGPMIQGLRLPMHDLSRGCSTEDMVQTTLLAMRMGGLVSADAPGAAQPLKEA